MMSRFETTRWSLVIAARGADVRSQRALGSLCRTYRTPVLAYIRSRGDAREDAEDLTQAFFTRFIEHGFHERADPARGRFRAYLLTALQRFLNDAHDRRQALKRGGRTKTLSLDSVSHSDPDAVESDDDSPERAFDRAWAKAVLQSAMRKLRREAKAAGKIELFDQLWEFVVERPDDADYARVATALNLRRNTLAVAVHRLRNRLRELVYSELAETAADAENLDQELDELRHCLGPVLQ
jgi:RNA polymerase sigma-70 factor (ECF subfamily)